MHQCHRYHMTPCSTDLWHLSHFGLYLYLYIYIYMLTVSNFWEWFPYELHDALQHFFKPKNKKKQNTTSENWQKKTNKQKNNLIQQRRENERCVINSVE